MPGTVTSPGLRLLDEIGYTLRQVGVCLSVRVRQEAARENTKGWGSSGSYVWVNETRGSWRCTCVCVCFSVPASVHVCNTVTALLTVYVSLSTLHPPGEVFGLYYKQSCHCHLALWWYGTWIFYRSLCNQLVDSLPSQVFELWQALMNVFSCM